MKIIEILTGCMGTEIGLIVTIIFGSWIGVMAVLILLALIKYLLS